jgi:hypothetical protein
MIVHRAGSGGGSSNLVVLELLKPLGHPLAMVLAGSFIKEVVAIQHITTFQVHMVPIGRHILMQTGLFQN